MEKRGTYTYEEIFSQPEAWEAALSTLEGLQPQAMSLFIEGAFSHVIFTGCGSTYYLSEAAGSLVQTLTGLPARGVPASELWLYPDSAYPGGTGRILLVAVSRSGATTETLKACQSFQALGRGQLLTLSCYADQPLASMGDLNIVLPSGAERSMAQTRAFSTLYLASIALASAWSNRANLLDELWQLPKAAGAILEQSKDLARSMGSDLDLERFYFLGSGLRFWLAAELSLKMKEMSLSHSEPFHFYEFRHGPRSMVNEHTLITALVSGRHSGRELQVLEELRPLGAKTLSMGIDRGDVAIPSNISEMVHNILYLPVGQLVAYERSMAKGLDPDNPNNLVPVIKLDE